MNVKQNSIMMRSSFPEESQNSVSPYHLTAKRLMILIQLVICGRHDSDLDLPIEDNACCADCGQGNILSPESQYQIQGTDFPWNEDGLWNLISSNHHTNSWTIDQPYKKKFQPSINPNASSIHLLPIRMNDPETGIKTAISAMQLFTAAMKKQ